MKTEIKERVERAIEAAMPAPALQGISPAALEQDGRHILSFLKRRYAPGKYKGRPVPGLRDTGLSPEVREDITYLVPALAAANIALVQPEVPFPVAEARALVTEMRVTLDWLTVCDPTLGPLSEKLKSDIPNSSVPSAWVLAIDHYVEAFHPLEDRLRQMPAFDMPVLDQARRLTRAYEEGGADARETADARRTAIMFVLRERIRLVVAAADYAFRKYPTLAAQARSDRIHRQQAAAAETRRRKRLGASAAAAPEAPAPAAHAEPTPEA